ALRALLGHDVIDVLRDRGVRSPLVLVVGAALVDGRIRTLGLTGAAVDALLRDHRGHGGGPYRATVRVTTRTTRKPSGRDGSDGGRRRDLPGRLAHAACADAGRLRDV